MRRSSTTVSGPATVRLRRYGEKLPPTTSRKMLTPRLKAARLLQDASTVDRSPSPAGIGYLSAIYRTLCPVLLLRFLHQRQGGAGAAGCGLHLNGLLRLAP
jgi:hypothetical protein